MQLNFCHKLCNCNLFINYLLKTNNKLCSTSILGSAYQPKLVERHSLENNPSRIDSMKDDNPKFSMILPPPNVTGNLHLGHALTVTIQDVISRWKQKKGFDVIWIPGTDHAGIATQVVVEKKLMKERNLSRHDLGRQKFIEEIWKWKIEKGDNIKNNLQTMGLTLNWDREFFTMDKEQSEAVIEAFILLFEKGLIYRNSSLINWSCSLESAISDIEVENLEINGPTSIAVPGYEKNITFGEITDIAYQFETKDDEDELEIIVSTTRPETLLGDVAVAVNPDDSRYCHLRKINRKLWHPFRNEPIPLIFDDSVDIEFGTGAVKITPAHDKYDFEIAKKHSLPIVNVINEKGFICNNFGSFSGMPRFEARERIKWALAELGLFRSTKPHNMILPICSRSKDVIEYLIRPQWFLNCKKSSQAAIEAVQKNRLNIHPKIFEKTWFKWLSEHRDWCISRQLWWGHQIPIYQCKFGNNEKWVAAKSKSDALRKAERLFKCNQNEMIKIEQDSDVLDTWFSSALLPFSALGWPNKTNVLEKYYPLSLMETGHDILFFWVARMVMLGYLLTDQIPFKQVLLHGIICDAQGRKMSKSLGNILQPEQIINGTTLKDLLIEIELSHKAGIISQSELEKSVANQRKMFPNGIPECGTDALRFTLCSHNIKNYFINFDVTECHTNKLFFNKIWQATRFLLKSMDNIDAKILKNEKIESLHLNEMDKWILSRLANTIDTVEKSIEAYNFHLATSALKTFFYSNVCDVFVETVKLDIAGKNQFAASHCLTLATCLSHGLQYMELFTPFLANELIKFLPTLPAFPVPKWINNSLEEEITQILQICGAVRQIKSQNQIIGKHEPKVEFLSSTENTFMILQKYLIEIKSLTFCKEADIYKDQELFEKHKHAVRSTAGHLCSFGILMNQDKSESQLLNNLNYKKLLKLKLELDKIIKITASDGYKQSASETIQQKHLEKINRLKKEIKNIKGI